MKRLTALALLLLVAPLAAKAEGAARRGHLLLCGGGEMPAGYWERFLDLAGGKDAPIVVLPTASERPEAGGEAVDDLAAHGATSARWLPLRTVEDARRPEIVAALRAARGVFLTGGDQNRITAALLDTPSEEALRTLFAAGGVLGGTSAGTACMSDPMITGGGDFTKLAAGSVERKRGLGFLSGILVDQHFVARQRQNRLLVSVLERPELLGVGIDERTAVWFRPDGAFEVFGAGWVEVYDASAARVRGVAGAQGTPLAADGVRVHLLVDGDRFDPARRERMDAP